jgi:hypothetical protein
MLDPASPANASRAPSSLARMGAYPPPSHYNRPYDVSVPNLSYDAPAYAPPPGLPPSDDIKPPMYGSGPDYDDGKYMGGDGKRGVGGDSKDDPFADFEARGRDDPL